MSRRRRSIRCGRKLRPRRPRADRLEFRVTVTSSKLQVRYHRWQAEHGTQKTEKHQAQRNVARGYSRSARTLFQRQRRRSSSRPDRCGPFSRGPERGESERLNPAQGQPRRHGPAQGETSRRRSFRRKSAQGRSPHHGHDGSDSSGGRFDRSSGQWSGILSLRPFECEFPARASAQCESALGKCERRKVFWRRYGRGHPAGDGFDRCGSFRRRPLHRASSARLHPATSRKAERLEPSSIARGWQSAFWRGSLSRKKTNPFLSPVATPVTQLERSAVRERVLDVIRGLLDELGSQGALPMLNPASQLDRDLGLGSLERVELLARLETAFRIRLPDRVASEANTPEDLSRALLSAPGTNAGVFSAETLIDVLRYRAAHDAERTHLLITEDTDGQERGLALTFGELYSAGQRCAAELARRGVPAGGRVALMLPTSRAFFVSYAGILLAGAIPVPIYPP